MWQGLYNSLWRVVKSPESAIWETIRDNDMDRFNKIVAIASRNVSQKKAILEQEKDLVFDPDPLITPLVSARDPLITPLVFALQLRRFDMVFAMLVAGVEVDAQFCYLLEHGRSFIRNLRHFLMDFQGSRSPDLLLALLIYTESVKWKNPLSVETEKQQLYFIRVLLRDLSASQKGKAIDHYRSGVVYDDFIKHLRQVRRLKSEIAEAEKSCNLAKESKSYLNLAQKYLDLFHDCQSGPQSLERDLSGRLYLLLCAIISYDLLVRYPIWKAYQQKEATGSMPSPAEQTKESLRDEDFSKIDEFLSLALKELRSSQFPGWEAFEIGFTEIKRGESEESVHLTVPSPNIQGLQYQQVSADGDCLFRAVGLCLGQDASFLRSAVAAIMAKDREIFHPYRGGTEEEFRAYTKELRAYINDVRNEQEWGDHIEIEIIQRIMERPIIILQPNDNPIIPDNIEEYGAEVNPIFLYREGPHYDALLVEGGFEGREILGEIQRRLAAGEEVHYTKNLELTQSGERSQSKAPDLREFSIVQLTYWRLTKGILSTYSDQAVSKLIKQTLQTRVEEDLATKCQLYRPYERNIEACASWWKLKLERQEAGQIQENDDSETATLLIKDTGARSLYESAPGLQQRRGQKRG